MSGGMAQGDLGFIGARSGGQPLYNSKMFTGSTPNPSKKGNFGYSIAQKAPPTNADTIVSQPEIASQGMLSKRCDWLESQERQLRASLSDARSRQETMDQTMSNEKKIIDDLNEQNKKVNLRTQQLFNEMQWVYGKASKDVMGFECGTEARTSLDRYKKDRSSAEVKQVSKKGEWLMLIYPMEKVDVSPTHSQFLMRCKSVHPRTGQLSVCWVVVYENKDGEDNRIISEFSLSK